MGWRCDDDGDVRHTGNLGPLLLLLWEMLRDALAAAGATIDRRRP